MQKHSLSIVCGWFVVTLSLMIVASWHFDLTIQQRLLPNAPQSTPLAAAILLTLSIALRISRKIIAGQLASRWLWASWSLSSAAVLTVLWVLLQDIFRLGPNVELEVYAQLLLQHSGAFLGHPLPHTAVSCFLIGLSIGLSPLAGRWSSRTTLILGLVGFTVPWLALFDYVGLHNPFYALPSNPQTGMSPLTAIGLLALCAGVMGLRPAAGLVEFLTSASAGGRMVKWLVPVAVGAPLLFGWFAIYHQELDALDSSVVFALSWGITCLLHAALIIWTGVVLHKDDTERGQAAQEHATIHAGLEDMPPDPSDYSTRNPGYCNRDNNPAWAKGNAECGLNLLIFHSAIRLPQFPRYPTGCCAPRGGPIVASND